MAPRIYLVGTTEVGLLLGKLSRQRIYQITVQRGFPEPVAELAQGKVWLGEQVEAWVAARRVRLAKQGRNLSAASGVLDSSAPEQVDSPTPDQVDSPTPDHVDSSTPDHVDSSTSDQ
jgi:prophage regulatory protein